jgi:glycosyltransferase involved in cell wall biosynthesis
MTNSTILPVRAGVIQIANGFSSETRVLASLIRHRPTGEFSVVQHRWDGDPEVSTQFSEASQVKSETLDFGWRPPARRRRELPAKVIGRARFRRALPRVTRALGADCVEVVLSSQQAWDCAAATYVSTRLRLPQVIHLHYVIGPWLGRVALDRLRTCEHVVAVSDFIHRQAIEHGVAPTRVTTVRNTVEPAKEHAEMSPSLHEELGLAPSVQLISFVGRLDPFKGHAETLDAFARVAARHIDVHLVIAGSGSIEEDLRVRARRQPGAGRVHFLGVRHDVDRVLAASSVFVHPSYNEPFGLAVLEAAAAGLPVVAFDSGATSEIVVHGKTGLLARPGNVDDLAAHLDALLSDSDRRRALGNAGRNRAELHFRPQDAAEKYVDVLRGVVEDRLSA